MVSMSVNDFKDPPLAGWSSLNRSPNVMEDLLSNCMESDCLSLFDAFCFACPGRFSEGDGVAFVVVVNLLR